MQIYIYIYISLTKFFIVYKFPIYFFLQRYMVRSNKKFCQWHFVIQNDKSLNYCSYLPTYNKVTYFFLFLVIMVKKKFNYVRHFFFRVMTIKSSCSSVIYSNVIGTLQFSYTCEQTLTKFDFSKEKKNKTIYG